MKRTCPQTMGIHRPPGRGTLARNQLQIRRRTTMLWRPDAVLNVSAFLASLAILATAGSHLRRSFPARSSHCDFAPSVGWRGWIGVDGTPVVATAKLVGCPGSRTTERRCLDQRGEQQRVTQEEILAW